MANTIRRYGAAGVLVIALWQMLWAQRPGYVQSNYIKHEFHIAMRDGKKLFTAVYEPKDHSHMYPIMLNRTPYGVGPYGKDSYPSSLGPSDDLG